MEHIINVYEDESIYIITTNYRQFIDEKKDISSNKQTAFRFAKEGNFEEFIKAYDYTLYYMYKHKINIEHIQIQGQNYIKYQNRVIPAEYKNFVSDNLFYPLEFYRMVTIMETVYNKQRKKNLLKLWSNGSIKIYQDNKVNIYLANFSMTDRFELLNDVDYRRMSSISANITDILDNFVLKKYTISDSHMKLTYNKNSEKKYCKYCGKEIKFFDSMDDICDICAFGYGLISYKEII